MTKDELKAYYRAVIIRTAPILLLGAVDAYIDAAADTEIPAIQTALAAVDPGGV